MKVTRDERATERVPSKVLDMRRTAGEITSHGLHYSRAVAAGPYVFLSGVAVDPGKGTLADTAIVNHPYRKSMSAAVEKQSQYIFGDFKATLEQFGSSIDQIVQVEQWVTSKGYGPAYADIRGQYLKTKRPGTILVCVKGLLLPELVVGIDAISIIPSEGTRKEVVNLAKPVEMPVLGARYEEPMFSDVIKAGDYAFYDGEIASDLETSPLVEEARPKLDWIWWGIPIKLQAEFCLKREEKKAEVAGSSMSNLVNVDVCLTDMNDLYDLDSVWTKYFPSDPPARTVIPATGLGIPRTEGPVDGTRWPVVEMIFTGIVPSDKTSKEVIKTERGSLSHESEGVKAGPLLWTSNLVAADKGGLVASPDIGSQTRFILEHISAICKAAGTSLANTVKIRAMLTDATQVFGFFAELKKAIPSKPPAVTVVHTGALPVQECSIGMSAIVYVP
jgi:enamine deaminase RidA (YjgF/YER057c/UK114 family)